MSKHKMTPGTQGQPKPMSGKEAQRHLSPGPKFPGFHKERPVKNNVFNTDPKGTAKPWRTGNR